MTVYKQEYNSEEERSDLIEENSHLNLIEDQSIKEGNFLIFAEEPITEKITYINVPKAEIKELKQESTMNMVAMTEMYESNVQMEQENTNTMIAVTELYEMLLGGD